jgi:hypothetical protein
MYLNKTALVKIYGGFGNQLFQYCFANYLKCKNINVYINNYWFKSSNDKYSRKEIFIPEFYGFREANSFNLRLYEYSDRYLRESRGSIYSFYDDESFENKVHGYLNSFIGIWQDKKYLKDSQSFLLEHLSKNTTINKSLKKNISKNSVMLHIRKANYVGEELNLDHYLNCIKYIKNKHGDNTTINLFSDYINITKYKDLMETVDSINLPDDNNPEDVINTFSKMLQNEHFIISNSTYSYMAAFIKNSERNTILMPRPWMVYKKNKLLNFPGFTEIER